MADWASIWFYERLPNGTFQKQELLDGPTWDRLGGLDPFDFNNKAQVRRFEIADWDGDEQMIEFHVVVVFFLFAVLLFVLWAA